MFLSKTSTVDSILADFRLKYDQLKEIVSKNDAKVSELRSEIDTLVVEAERANRAADKLNELLG